jgi:hypothetical protein
LSTCFSISLISAELYSQRFVRHEVSFQVMDIV